MSGKLYFLEVYFTKRPPPEAAPHLLLANDVHYGNTFHRAGLLAAALYTFYSVLTLGDEREMMRRYVMDGHGVCHLAWPSHCVLSPYLSKYTELIISKMSPLSKNIW